MTYFSFLLRFIGIPLAALLVIALIDSRRGRTGAGFHNGRPVWMTIGLLAVLAVVYTTPWDNYLVASGVWYYDPDLISGILIGWVPLEEYTFFVVETILVGLWWWFLARRVRPPDVPFTPGSSFRVLATAVLGVIWLASLLALASGWQPGTYLALILAWALPPVMLQTAFGADILFHHRKLVTLVILPVFVYLSATDSLAIAAGTWTIDPAQSTGVMFGPLPVEEAVFFLITVVLITFGLTLALARESQARLVLFRSRTRTGSRLQSRKQA